MTKCAECASTRLERATIDGAAVRLETGPLRKRVFNVGGLIFCEICLDCGLIGPMRGDPAALARMLE